MNKKNVKISKKSSKFFNLSYQLFTLLCAFFSHEVPKRANSKKIEVKGIFSNARVVRGPDWDWGNQDGMYLFHNTWTLVIKIDPYWSPFKLECPHPSRASSYQPGQLYLLHNFSVPKSFFPWFKFFFIFLVNLHDFYVYFQRRRWKAG